LNNFTYTKTLRFILLVHCVYAVSATLCS